MAAPISRQVAQAQDAVQPELAPIQKTTQLFGLSRSSIYREAGAGNIRLVKYGRSTLVDVASVRSFLAALPVAAIRNQRAA